MPKTKTYSFIIFSILFLILFAASAGAQDFSIDWSEPELLFLVTDGLRSNYLSSLYDRASTVYVWWATFSAIADDTSTDLPKSRTFHSQNIANEWRSPVDVMIWPDAGRMTSVVIDDDGILHAFSATNCLNYTTAPQDQAMSARGWNNNGCLDGTGLSFPSAVMTTDGTIYVVYSTLGNHSYRLIKSNDRGVTWSSYLTILEEEEDFLLDPMLTIDQEDRLHLVWSIGQAPDAYPPSGVFYTRSDDGGISWKTPFQFGGLDEGEPAIAVFDDEVHVLWNGDAAKRGRYYRYSPDAGETWSTVEVLTPPSDLGGKGGLQRPPAIVVDNLGNVHVLLHEQEELYYAKKSEIGWSPKERLYNPELMKGVEIFGIRLAITEGNLLHAMYILESYDRSITEDRRNHIWRVFHQYKEIDALNELPTPWPTSELEGLEITPDNHKTEELLATSTVLSPSENNFDNDLDDPEYYNPAWSFYVSGITVSLFILIMLVFLIIKKRS